MIGSTNHSLINKSNFTLQIKENIPVEVKELNQTFKTHFEAQLHRIRNILEKAILSETSEKEKPSTHMPLDEMEAIFRGSEALLNKHKPLAIEQHPLFSKLKEGTWSVILNSGPDIENFTTLLLNKHGLNLEKANQIDHINLNIFNNGETFLRAFDIFKTHFEKTTGKTIETDLSYSLIHQPLDEFCKRYVSRYPELAHMNPQEREKFVRLLAVFNIENDIVEMNLNLKMNVTSTSKSGMQRSFFPMNQKHDAIQNKTNEISMGQIDLKHQIQNLNGSEESMRYIKNADGQVQFNAFATFLGCKDIKIVDIGGGRGETNAVPYALKEAGSEVHLLNIEPNEAFAEPYRLAHQVVGIQDVHVMQKSIQTLTTANVMEHFKGEKIDAVFASHAFYFILNDLYKASLDSFMQIEQHPLWKYFDMMCEHGKMIVTMQTGAGARLYRNALLGNHGLNPPSIEVPDETVPLLSSFGNIATFLRYLEAFAKRYQEKTGREIQVKMHYCVANVPLGQFEIIQNSETGGYEIHNPVGEQNDPNWLSPSMLDFYGNWKELQTSATSAKEKTQRDLARKTQETFLHILRPFAPAELNMKHPNITLEISTRS